MIIIIMIIIIMKYCIYINLCFVILGIQFRYVCPYTCGHSYTRKDNLTRHMKTRCGALKTFVCRICEKSYARRDALKNHLKLVHKCLVELSVDNINFTY